MPGMMTRGQRRALGIASQPQWPADRADALMDELEELIDQDATYSSDDEDSTVDMDADESSDDESDDGDVGLSPLQWANDIPVPKPARSAARRTADTRSWLRLLLENVFWSTIGGATLLPLLLYRCLYAPYWPLRCRSIFSFLWTVLLNWVALGLVASLAFASACDAQGFLAGRLFKWPPSVAAIEACIAEHNVMELLAPCLASQSLACLPLDGVSLASVYTPLLQALLALLVLLLLGLRFYSSRVKAILFLLFAGHHGWKKLDGFTARSSSALTGLEPSFAYANEPISVLLDGYGLHEGAYVGWIPYWACGKDQTACPVESVTRLHHGSVAVTFATVDEYIPCYYRAPVHENHDELRMQNLASHVYTCFHELRLVVKDRKSQPGWSLHAHEL
ncbi:hypothetical protein SDRG_04872 [Saprolegnia diclina VS20]|uniref:Uncharacterized protein n=1 Tax=Saprolegnia diclina (strain VS20) TaxID=1156394 RepID=T0QIL7_SAPDV|nr:hypothetical protein SDRG_04872 [Saprolegnia diclina VS20]EQC37849.1 hypothetical protein SDRG_04872 [Saprolegnia diclina VS20]|eukprot:XP_008608782.1 hypothetical protein SDRG_04872 [Saprolegnia diclina VS20]